MADIYSIMRSAASVVAPVLANAIIPGSGGLAASLLAKALGTGANPEDINTALLNATPAQILEIKKLEIDNATELVRIGADLDKEYLKDRQNARARDIESIKMGVVNVRANWMVAGDVLGLMACLGTLFMIPDMTEATRAVIITFGSYFGLCLRDAHQFEFGSSRGSKDKDMKIA